MKLLIKIQVPVSAAPLPSREYADEDDYFALGNSDDEEEDKPGGLPGPRGGMLPRKQKKN